MQARRLKQWGKPYRKGVLLLLHLCWPHSGQLKLKLQVSLTQGVKASSHEGLI